MTKEKFLQLNKGEVLVVDIREAGEVAELPSPAGAMHIPLATFAAAIEAESFPKDKPIVTVCRGGGRCLGLQPKLIEHGYHADYLEGGVLGLQ